MNTDGGLSLSDIIDIHKNVGYELILLYLQAFDNHKCIGWKNYDQPMINNSLYLQEYSHCMYSVNYFEWLLTDGMINDIYVNAEDDKDDYISKINCLNIEPNYLYTCCYQFDEVCHLFTFTSMPNHLIIFNTSQDHPNFLSIMTHDLLPAVGKLKSILLGDMRFYHEMFGFTLPINKRNCQLDSVDIHIKKFKLMLLTLEMFIDKIDTIDKVLTHTIDKNTFQKIQSYIKEY